MHEFPYRLRLLRQHSRLTLERLAQLSGLTRSYLSKLERGISEPSISTVLKLAGAFGVDASQLIAIPGEDDKGVVIVRTTERAPLARGNSGNGYRYEALAGRKSAGLMNPFVVYPPHAGEGKPAVFPHDGEEFMLVLDGTVNILVGEKSYTMGVGDTIYFDSNLPHCLFSVSDEVAQVLVVASVRSGG